MLSINRVNGLFLMLKVNKLSRIALGKCSVKIGALARRDILR